VQLQSLQDNAKKIKNALNSWHVLSYQDMFILFHISIKSKSVYITDQTKLAKSLLLWEMKSHPKYLAQGCSQMWLAIQTGLSHCITQARALYNFTFRK